MSAHDEEPQLAEMANPRESRTMNLPREVSLPFRRASRESRPPSTHLSTSLPPFEQRTPYVYYPLNEEAQQIRMLTILPDTFKSEIRVRLHRTQLVKNSKLLEFEALSYAWGSAESPVEILVGETGFHTLSVTRNLAEAMPYLRYEDKPRIIWVDAICVNQQDLTERTSQVKRMADVYSKASLVVVWLGPESDDSRMAVKCCKEVSTKIKVNWVFFTMSPVDFDKEDGTESVEKTDWTDLETSLPFSEREQIAIFRFLSRDWFDRLWIWQEVALAREVVAWKNVRDTMFSVFSIYAA